MEKWQKHHLTINRAKLVEETFCNELMFSYLVAQQVLANADVERIKRKTDRYEQAAALYDTLETRTNGYVALAVALAKLNQTGPLGVFIEGLAQHVIPDIKVTFLGMDLHLTDVYEGPEMQRILNEMKQHLTIEKCVRLYDKSKKTEEPIKLIRDTIPEKISCYVSRSLSKRVNVNPEVYKVKCSDAFVFKGIGWSELQQLVEPERVQNSSTQLLSLSTRFIILEQVEDWEEICITARVPVHLIKYEQDNGQRNILEATTGGSTVIHQFLKFQQTTESQNETVSISEDAFFEEVSREGASGVCICDLPGMGKSLLLANLARKMKQEHPDRIVAFIQLSHFLTFAMAKKGIQATFQPDETLTKKMLLEYLTQSPFEYFLLTELLEKTVTQLELFFDGFDEIQLGHVEVAKKLLTSASRLPNTRIFVTSRPNMRHELEASLHVISYDILPFSNANQINFLVAFWINLKPTCQNEKLREFAEFCIKNLKNSLKDDEEAITGIPLQCRLVAEVFSRNALIFAHPKRNASVEELCTIESSITDMYKRYFDLRFNKHIKFNFAGSAKLFVSAVAEQATRLVEAVVGGRTCLLEIQDLKKFHMLQALKLLFPEKSEVFSQVFMEITTTPPLSSVLSVGILQRQLTRVGQEAFQFIHRTFAEYLVAELFANFLYDEKGEKKLRKKLLQFLFQEVMRTNDYGSKSSFVHGIVLHFLNAACADKIVNPKDKVLFAAFSASVTNTHLLSVIKTVIRYNFLNLLILLKQLVPKMSLFRFQSTKRFLFRTSTPRLSELLSTAARYGDVPLVENFFQLLHECFRIDPKGRGKELFVFKEFYHENPLTTAISSRNYEVAELFAQKILMEKSYIISIFKVKNFLDETNQLERKLRILNILLDRNKNLVKDEPLVLANWSSVYVDVFKLLLRSGIDLRAAYGGKTIVHRAALELSGEPFSVLCRLLIIDLGAIDLFEEVEEKWTCPLPDILANQRISDQTILKIYDLPWLVSSSESTVEAESWPCHSKICVDINYSDDWGNTLLMHAVLGKRSMGVIRRMIEKGADVWVKEKRQRGYNFVHYFSVGRHSAEEYDELVQMLVNMRMGKVFQANDKYGETPLHKAIFWIELYPKTLNVLMAQNCYVDVNAVNKRGESFLHIAVKRKRSLVLVKHLVELGADWSIKTKKGHNLAHVSSFEGLVDHLKYFVELGCDINEVDQEGNNTLQYAVSYNANTTVEVIQFLIESGAQKDNKNKMGETAYMIATENRWVKKDEKILQLLK